MENNEIHECEFKKGKMQDVLLTSQGNYICSRCRQELPLNQLHSNVFKRKK
jgi:hypothetical protein